MAGSIVPIGLDCAGACTLLRALPRRRRAAGRTAVELHAAAWQLSQAPPALLSAWQLARPLPAPFALLVSSPRDGGGQRWRRDGASATDHILGCVVSDSNLGHEIPYNF
eukprot:SAG31_NODE_3877_length_3791_cov_45.339382_4_plen_109_part_00